MAVLPSILRGGGQSEESNVGAKKGHQDVSALFWETVFAIADERGWETVSEISERTGYAYARVHEAMCAREQNLQFPGIQTTKWQETLDRLGMCFWDFVCHHPSAPMAGELGVPAQIQSRMAAVLDPQDMHQLVTFAEITVERRTFKELLSGLIGTLRATE